MTAPIMHYSIHNSIFWRRYRPENMAVVAVGDFSDPDAIVSMVREYLEPCAPRAQPAVPEFRCGPVNSNFGFRRMKE